MAVRSAGQSLAIRQSTLPDVISCIKGNVPAKIKEIPVKWLALFRNEGKSFGGSISGRLRVTEVSVLPNVDDPLKMEGKVVCEIEVTPGN